MGGMPRSESRRTRAATTHAAAIAAGHAGPAAALVVHRFLLRHWQQSLALRLLAGELAGAADRLGFLAGLALGGLLVGAPLLHLTEHALALHLLLQHAERLVDVVVANENLQWNILLGLAQPRQRIPGRALAGLREACD